jgi:hypothetical protein
MSMGVWPNRLGAMVRLARNCGTVGVSSTGTGDRMRITVAMTRAARKSRHQPRRTRDHELPDGLLAFDRHQDHEAADDEEQLDPEVAGP